MNNSQQLESYVPVYDTCPEDWEEARGFLTEQLKKISNAVNIREIGWFLDEELLSGKTLFPGVNVQGNASPDQNRQILRKVIDFGALPNAGTKSVAHGIVFDANFSLVQMWAASTAPSSAAIPIPYVEVQNPTGAVQLYMDTTNINITTDSDRSAYTRTFVVIEYIQEL